MDLVVVAGAFAFGFLAVQVGLPPLVGYLVAGFALHALGYEVTPVIEDVAELGLLLLLFGIGLKLDLRHLGRPTVWGTTVLVGLAVVAVVGGALMALRATTLPLVGGLDLRAVLVVAFALSFSSTVLAVKVLEDQGEIRSLAGGVAIGILVVQDLFAVAFLAASSASLPSWWAVPLVLGLVLARPLLSWVLDHTGHGELQLLLGFTLVVAVGAGGFELVGLKPDLGALVVGALLSGHTRAKELSDRLLGLKDLLLVGFFLSIGLGGTPTPASIAVAAVAVALLPLKAVAFVVTLTRLRLRARTSLHASLTLTSYSEFGLIVASVAAAQGWLGDEWLATLAVAVALSFALASLATARRYRVYDRFGDRLHALQRDDLRPEDALIDPEDAEVLVFGLGRVGTGAYDEMVERRGNVVLGVERRPDRIQVLEAEGRRVIFGDALDSEFWERVRLVRSRPEIVLLAMGDHDANLEAVRRVRENLPHARIAAVARWPDEIAELEEAGVHVARNLYAEAGAGLADDIAPDPPHP